MRLLDFVRDHVTLFLEDPDVSVRRAAAAAAAKVLHRAASIPPGSHGSISQNQVSQNLSCYYCSVCDASTSKQYRYTQSIPHGIRGADISTITCADAHSRRGGCGGPPADGSLCRWEHCCPASHTALNPGALLPGHLPGTSRCVSALLCISTSTAAQNPHFSAWWDVWEGIGRAVQLLR